MLQRPQLKMQVFQTGLQVMIANDSLPREMDRRGAEELLMETGDELLRAALFARKNGFRSIILEKNSIAGGVCLGWDRKG